MKFTNVTFDEIEIGKTLTVSRTISRNDIEALTFVSGDIDEAYLDIEVGPDQVPSAEPVAAEAFISYLLGGILDGPLAFDNAVSKQAAKTKKIDSPVAGKADILLVSDLKAGNMLAKTAPVPRGSGCGGYCPRHPCSYCAHEPRRQRAHQARINNGNVPCSPCEAQGRTGTELIERLFVIRRDSGLQSGDYRSKKFLPLS